MYRALTHDIEITVEPFYLEEQSEPDESRFVWGYRIVIVNHSEQTVQLRDRYWRITDALGQVDEISGEGVVGEQPVLEPGDRFEYSSGCPLDTSSGMMVFWEMPVLILLTVRQETTRWSEALAMILSMAAITTTR